MTVISSPIYTLIQVQEQFEVHLVVVFMVYVGAFTCAHLGRRSNLDTWGEFQRLVLVPRDQTKTFSPAPFVWCACCKL
jgi:hypothetical protein